MTRAEKLLYHQIHPLKLFTDFATSGVASALLWWRAPWTTFLLVAFVPSVIVTALLLRWSDLERLKASLFGRYVQASMTSAVTTQRVNGQIVMWVGAWSHEPLFMGLGLGVVLLAWASGLGRPQAPPSEVHATHMAAASE